MFPSFRGFQQRTTRLSLLAAAVCSPLLEASNSPKRGNASDSIFKELCEWKYPSHWGQTAAPIYISSINNRYLYVTYTTLWRMSDIMPVCNTRLIPCLAAVISYLISCHRVIASCLIPCQRHISAWFCEWKPPSHQGCQTTPIIGFRPMLLQGLWKIVFGLRGKGTTFYTPYQIFP